MAVATIRARKSADGSLRYTAQLRIRNNGAQVYQDSPTFSPKQAAQVWAQRLELYPFGLIVAKGADHRAIRQCAVVQLEDSLTRPDRAFNSWRYFSSFAVSCPSRS